MAMEQQMEMFGAGQMGRLEDDGMTRDPVSGNEIPPGSMANEVRDDVDAKLSDGEYVVPANVVRYYGVKYFEDLRNDAMRGLADMESKGRIGGEPVQEPITKGQPPISDQEMQMLQSMMNEGGVIKGFQEGGLNDPITGNPIPQSIPSSYYPLSQFASPGASTISSALNPYVTPATGTTPTVEESTGETSLVTFVNPATGEVQVLQYIGGKPVDSNAYNTLINSGYFVQGSPELAQYKQQQDQDSGLSGGNRPGEIPIRPHPSEANISQLGQLIAESSKGGGSLLEIIPSVTGAVTGKLAEDHRNDITKALDKMIEGSTNVANKKAAELMKEIWTNEDLSKTERANAIAEAGIFKNPGVQNMLGKKAGEYGTKGWYGYATQAQLDKKFGVDQATKKDSTVKTAKTTPSYEGARGIPVRSQSYMEEMQGKQKAIKDAAIRERVDAYQEPDPSGRSLAERARDYTPPPQTEKEEKSDKAAEAAGATRSRGGSREFGMNKGGLLKKPTKKKTKTKTKK